MIVVIIIISHRLNLNHPALQITIHPPQQCHHLKRVSKQIETIGSCFESHWWSLFFFGLWKIKKICNFITAEFGCIGQLFLPNHTTIKTLWYRILDKFREPQIDIPVLYFKITEFSYRNTSYKALWNIFSPSCKNMTSESFRVESFMNNSRPESTKQTRYYTTANQTNFSTWTANVYNVYG